MVMNKATGLLLLTLIGPLFPLVDLPATPTDISGIIQQVAEKLVATAVGALSFVNSTVIEVSRAAYVTILLLGVLLYFTHLERRLGRDLIRGGIILVVLLEFVIPFIGRF